MPAYTREFTVDWGDCDAMGIVFYPNYFRWIDATFHAMCAELGFSQKSLPQYGVVGTPLADVGCTFRSPVSYNDRLHVQATVAHLGSSSFRMEYLFHAGERLAAQGFEMRVCVAEDPDGIHAAPIPEAIRTLLESHRK